MSEKTEKDKSSPTSNDLEWDSSLEEESPQNVFITELASKVFMIDEVR